MDGAFDIPSPRLTAAFAASPPVRDLVFAIAKIVVSFDYDSTLNSPIGAPFLHIFVGDAGKSLVVRFKMPGEAQEQTFKFVAHLRPSLCGPFAEHHTLR